MTTKAGRQAKRGSTVRKGSKLALSKKTLADLTLSKKQGGAIRGGVGQTHTCGCF